MAATRVKVRGTPELRARLKAIQTVFRPVGRKWAQETRDKARRRAQFTDRTGKGRKSIRVRTASQKRATVVATFYVAILDKGTKSYTIVPKKAKRLRFSAGGNTVFARKVDKPAMRGMGFGAKAGRDALADNPMASELIRLWNGAA